MFSFMGGGRFIQKKNSSYQYLKSNKFSFTILFLLGVVFFPIQQADALLFNEKFGNFGTADGEFQSPWDIAVDSQNRIIVADRTNSRVQIFDFSGTHLQTFGSPGPADGQFNNPQGIAVDSQDRIIVADSSNSRIQIFDSTGLHLQTFGNPGAAANQFISPQGIAVDSQDRIIVADTFNHRIQIFNSTGNFIKMFGWGVNSGSNSFETCISLCVIGSIGTGPGQFDHPEDITVDSQDRIIVADSRNHRIQIFDTLGTPLQTFGSEGTGDGEFSFPSDVTVDSQDRIIVVGQSNPRVQSFDSLGNHLQTFGIFGSADGQFNNPQGINVDSQDRIIVADTGNNRMQIFDSTGLHLQTFGNPGTAANQFDLPFGLTVDSQDRIIVADTFNHRIQIFDSSGNFTKMFGWDVASGADSFETCTSSCQSGSNGNGVGQFDTPRGITVDLQDRILVADSSNHRIQIFDSAGNPLHTFGSLGPGTSQFNTPQGITVDSQDRIIVADSFNSRIQIFDSTGNFIKMFGWGVNSDPNSFETCTSSCQSGSTGTGPGQFSLPIDITVDSQDRIIVADTSNSRIQIFDSSGNHIQSIGSPGPQDGKFQFPQGITVDLQDRIIVADTNNDRIQIFDSLGIHLYSFGSFGLVADGKFADPREIAVDSKDRIIVADTSNNRIQILHGSLLVPISYWKAENNAFDSTGTNDATLLATTFAPSQSGTAFSFDGSSNVEIPNSPSLNHGAFSYTAWVNVTGNVNQTRDIFSKDSECFGGCDANNQFLLTASDVNLFRPHVWTNTGPYFFDSLTPITSNQWYHLGVTYDGLSSLKLYIDGIQDIGQNFTGTAPIGPAVVSSQPVRIGGGAPPLESQFYFEGLIDEVKFFNIALDPQQICKESNAPSSIDSDSDGLPDTCDLTIYPPCTPLPVSGDWNITSTCILESNFTTPANVTVQNNSVLMIPNGITLTMPTGSNITVVSGGGILIESGGALIVIS